jgi:endonuclease YncB( thermonuclease family)
MAIVVALGRRDPPAELHGAARILDGDTLIVADRKVRIAGLDAPEYDQICRDGAGADWACGAVAQQRLTELTNGRAVDCRGEDHDRYGRLLAICLVEESDLGAEMVGLGLAVARERYEAEQADARSAEEGIWAGEFDDPEDWRRRGGEIPRGMGLMDWILKLFTS